MQFLYVSYKFDCGSFLGTKLFVLDPRFPIFHGIFTLLLVRVQLFLFTLHFAFLFIWCQQSYNKLPRLCATATTEFATGHQCWCTLPMEGVPVAIERSDAKRLMDQERSCQNIFFSHTSRIACPPVFKTLWRTRCQDLCCISQVNMFVSSFPLPLNTLTPLFNK